MKQILLLSHGPLALGLKETVTMIMGDDPRIKAIELPYEKDIKEYEKEIFQIIKQSESTIILVDLFGGTPFMTSARLSNVLLDDEQVSIITGMNLPMLVEISSNLDNMELPELEQIAYESGRQGIRIFKEE